MRSNENDPRPVCPLELKADPVFVCFEEHYKNLLLSKNSFDHWTKDPIVEDEL